MITILLIVGSLLLIVVGVAVAALFVMDIAFWPLPVGSLLILVGLIGSVIVTANVVDKHYSELACDRYTELTARETRFVHYTYWQWDCLVHTDQGWLPLDQVRAVEPSG